MGAGHLGESEWLTQDRRKLEAVERRIATKESTQETPSTGAAILAKARCERPGCFRGRGKGVLINNHTLLTDAAQPSTRRFRFLYGRNTLPVEIEMVRKIFRHEMI